jgi:hypothetical protein
MSNTASTSLPQHQCTELALNHLLSTHLGPHPPTANFLFHDKVLRLHAPGGSTSNDRTWPITGIDRLPHEGDQRTYKVEPRVDVQFVMKENQLEKARCEKGAS